MSTITRKNFVNDLSGNHGVIDTNNISKELKDAFANAGISEADPVFYKFRYNMTLMPKSVLKTSAVFGSLFIVMLFFVQPQVCAGSKEEVAAAVEKWSALFVDDNPDSILTLYDDDAVLWGTLSSKRLQGKQELRGYFEMAFKALPGHKVSFGDQLIRVYGDLAINTGYYTFSYTKEGKTNTLPARFSFVYRKQNRNWLIIDHHSSAMPSLPK